MVVTDGFPQVNGVKHHGWRAAARIGFGNRAVAQTITILLQIPLKEVMMGL
jgi:hypothetical protein